MLLQDECHSRCGTCAPIVSVLWLLTPKARKNQVCSLPPLMYGVRIAHASLSTKGAHSSWVVRLPGVRLLFLALVVAACTSATEGRRVEYPRNVRPALGPAVATALASDPAGLRVLANENGGSGRAGLLATTADEYAALWEDLGLHRPAPAVNFATHVVFGTSYFGGVCHPELVAAHVDAAGVLSLEARPTVDVCVSLAARVVQVVAVPRSILPAHFTWSTEDGDFAFDLAPRSASAPTITAPAIDAGLRPAITAPRGTVALPAAGRIVLASLDDGRQIWIARRSADDISVVLADIATRGPLRTIVTWDERYHRFSSGHDSRGRSVNAGPPLDVLTFARRADDRIAIGEPISVTYAPPIPRDREPTLDGPDKPYTATPTPFSALADRRFGVITESLVTGSDGQSRVCTLPLGKIRRFLRGCPTSAPSVFALPASGGRGGIAELTGPIVVHRTGATADIAISIGSGMAAWTVDATLDAPAARGPTRARGALTLATTARGDTSAAKNGFDAPATCMNAAALGSPDEAWTFTAPRAATYTFELDASYDGTLALVDATGRVIACADDSPADRRATLRLELAANQPVRVVVDGFGGQRGSYQLLAREQPALAHLAVGGSVTGDTTDAPDFESHGCHAPAGDHRYPLTITEAGLYNFRIETPGWAPMLSVLPAGSDVGCYTTVSPLTYVELLAPGDYNIIVDGSAAKEHGPYTLSVERCASDDKAACKR